MITPIWCLHNQRLRGYCVDEINDYAKHENFANISVRNRFSFFVWALVAFFYHIRWSKIFLTTKRPFTFTTELMVEHSKNIFSNCIYCWPSILFVYWDWEGGGGGPRGGKKYLRLFMLLSGLGACWLSGLRNDNEHRFHLQNKQTSCANTMKNWADITKYYIL